MKRIMMIEYCISHKWDKSEEVTFVDRISIVERSAKTAVLQATFFQARNLLEISCLVCCIHCRSVLFYSGIIYMSVENLPENRTLLTPETCKNPNNTMACALTIIVVVLAYGPCTTLVFTDCRNQITQSQIKGLRD